MSWEGRWFDYQSSGDMLVPITGEVAWLLPTKQGGRMPYWRGTINALTSEFAK